MDLTSLMLAGLLAQAPETVPTRPRLPEEATTPKREYEGTPTDPLFDKPQVATDDADFVLRAIENGRQAILDARGAAKTLPPGAVREAAVAIEQQNDRTTRELTTLAERKGWRVPQANPQRESSVDSSATRAMPDYVKHQIAAHEATVDLYRAQLGGNGDAELKSALRKALPGHERNLKTLLAINPRTGGMQPKQQ